MKPPVFQYSHLEVNRDRCKIGAALAEYLLRWRSCCQFATAGILSKKSLNRAILRGDGYGSRNLLSLCSLSLVFPGLYLRYLCFFFPFSNLEIVVVDRTRAQIGE
jgi:hypothetical protein